MNKLIRIYRYFLDTAGIIPLIKNWWVVYLSYLNLVDISRGVTIYLRNGLKFKIVHHLDALVLNEIIWKNDYKLPVFREKVNIIDIGANIGAFSIYAATKAPEAHIYSFEPSSNTFAQLQNNLKINKIKNVTPLNKGVFSKRGSIKLFDNNMSGQRSVYGQNEGGGYETVKLITLPQFIRSKKIKKIDFLKMDCEGSEYEILKSLSKADFKKISRISLEYHEFQKNQKKSVLKNILKDNGFEVKSESHKIEKNIGYIWASK